MKYSDGKDIKLGDKVLIDGKYQGVVVADMDGSEYPDAESKKWEYLRSGVMINTDFGGMVHYQQKDLESEDIVLASRK